MLNGLQPIRILVVACSASSFKLSNSKSVRSMMSVFLGIKRRKYNKKDVWCHTPFLSFQGFNISLASCSAAELVSVSVEHCKFQSFKLYLQTVKKASYLRFDTVRFLIISRSVSHSVRILTTSDFQNSICSLQSR